MKKQKNFPKLKTHLLAKYLSGIFLIMFILALFFNIWKYQNFEYLLDTERDFAEDKHDNICTILNGSVYLESSKTEAKTQSFELVKNSMMNVAACSTEETALFYNGNLVAGTYQDVSNTDSMLLQNHYDDKCYLEECEIKNIHYIKAVSSITLLGENYVLITTTDISDLYNLKDQLAYRIIILCIVCGVVLIISAFFTIKSFFKHMNKNDKFLHN